MAKKEKKDTVSGKTVRKNVYSSPQKARLVADLIRGETVEDALSQLTLSEKKVAKDFEKAVKTAVNNCKQVYKNTKDEDLEISEVYVGEGRKIKKAFYRAKGRTDIGVRRYCHIFVEVSKK
jgi:large subunit ribosomal protein L22